MDYQTARKAVWEVLLNGGSPENDLTTEIYQKRPYTVVFLEGVMGGERMLAFGCAKVNPKDRWNPVYGKKMALTKAVAAAAKQLAGKGEYLKVNGEHLRIVSTRSIYAPGGIPDDILDAEL